MFRRIGLLLLLFSTVIIAYAQEQDERLALETIARINEWRIAEGVWPLKINGTLTDMAIHHAEYLISLDELPDNLHNGVTGLNPRERALLEPFEWPHYQLPEQIAIGENAGIGTLDYAMGYWETSETHRKTSLNPEYREVGVAALPYKSGHMFIVVFGGRPNILPALLDPRDGQTIYLTNEQFQYAQFNNSVQSVAEIQIFDTEGKPLFDEPQPWSAVIEIPEGAGDIIYLLLSDGTHEVLTSVNRNTDQVIVLQSLLEPEPEEEPVVESEAEGETEVVTDTETEVASDEESEEEPVEEAQPTPEPTVEATPEEVEVVDQPDMLILYSGNTLDILNVSGSEQNWEGMELQGLITIQFTKFTQFTDLNLSAMPDRHCVQVRADNISGDVVKQESCRWVRSLVTVSPDRVFWNAGTFDVVRNGNTIATCSPDDSVCEIFFD